MAIRVLTSAAVTLTHLFYAPNTETLTDPTGTPTYTIVDAAGTTVASGNATVTGGGTGQVTAPLAGQPATNLLTVTWTGTVAGATLTESRTVEIVGGFFFNLDEARNSDSSLADNSRYTPADLLAARTAVERECEEICDRSFVPRYARVTLDGTGTSQLVLNHPDQGRSFADFRSIRSVSVAPQLDETFVAYTTAELADLAVASDGTVRRAGGDVFTEGWRNVVAGYEYGLSGGIPEDLKRVALTRLRTVLNYNKSGIPDRAASFTATDGGTYRLSMPGAYATGIPDVDAVYSRYSRRVRTGPAGMGGGPVPASRTLSYNPQRFSLFHGRR